MERSCGLLVLFGCLPFLDAVEFRSDYQFIPGADGWLKLHLIPATWQDARLQCYLEGAVLASPTNDQLLSAMVLELLFDNPDTVRRVFTGISAIYSKGDFYTIEGVPLSELNVTWAEDEPDNLGNGEECLIMHHDGTMADEKCQETFSYMCYRKKTEDMPPMTECGTTDTAYQLNAVTGSCYKFHYVARTWSEAFKTCSAEGGYLAVVNSPYEAKVLHELFRNSPKPIGMPSSEYVNLGFRYSEPQRTFITVHGQTLEQAGYARWSIAEPNNAKRAENRYEGEYCGSMYFETSTCGFNDIWCEHNNTFICEKMPKKTMNEASDFFKGFLGQVDRDHFEQESILDFINFNNEMSKFQDASTINPPYSELMYNRHDDDDDNYDNDNTL